MKYRITDRTAMFSYIRNNCRYNYSVITRQSKTRSVTFESLTRLSLKTNDYASNYRK